VHEDGLALQVVTRLPITEERIVPEESELYCQIITPACHPVAVYSAIMALLRAVPDMYELASASWLVAGLPTTTLLLGTPLVIISLTEVFGADPPEMLNKVLDVL